MRACAALATVPCALALACSASAPGKGVFLASPAAGLDFGLVACGTAGVPQFFTLGNTGTGPYGFTAALAAGSSSPYLLPASTGTVIDGRTLPFAVRPRALPASIELLPGSYGDTITFTTDISGDVPHAFPLKEGAQGGLLSCRCPAAASTSTCAGGVLDFGTVPTDATSTLALAPSLDNDGNAAEAVTLAIETSDPPSPFALAVPANVQIAAGKSLAVTVSFVPLQPGPFSALLYLASSGPDCRMAPWMTLTGRGE
jgi:hypothetical protein